jgi:hypothetical protein
LRSTGQIRLDEQDAICGVVAMLAPSPALRAPSPRWGEGARTSLERARQRCKAQTTGCGGRKIGILAKKSLWRNQIFDRMSDPNPKNVTNEAILAAALFGA